MLLVVLCNAALAGEVPKSSRVDMPHEKMTCRDCHQDAGHKTISPAPSCEGCHSDPKSKAPKAAHRGFTKLHMTRISCEACHIVESSNDGIRPGYIIIKGKILPVGEGGSVLHHDVAEPSRCLGANGCDDCHSRGSAFFFGLTTVDINGKQVRIPNYKAMRLDRAGVEFGIRRERYIKPFSGWLFVLVIALSAAHYGVFGPRRIKIPPEDPTIARFTFFERFVHALAVLSFLFLAITGMMFLLRIESPTSDLRSMHGHVGVLFTMAVIGMLAVWWKNALFVSCDIEWVRKLGGYLWIRGECPAEKFNAGQKLFYWLIVVLGGIVISVTGLILIDGRGAAPSWAFTLHDIAAAAIIAGIIGHAYLGLFANPGTIVGMIVGRVYHTWARYLYPNWLKMKEEAEETEPMRSAKPGP